MWHYSRNGLKKCVQCHSCDTLPVTSTVLSSHVISTYCQISTIRRTKSQHWNVFRLVLQLPVPNPLKPCVRSRMKMQLERRHAVLQLHLRDQQVYCLLRCDLYQRFDGTIQSTLLTRRGIFQIPAPNHYWEILRNMKVCFQFCRNYFTT